MALIHQTDFLIFKKYLDSYNDIAQIFIDKLIKSCQAHSY